MQGRPRCETSQRTFLARQQRKAFDAHSCTLAAVGVDRNEEFATEVGSAMMRCGRLCDFWGAELSPCSAQLFLRRAPILCACRCVCEVIIGQTKIDTLVECLQIKLFLNLPRVYSLVTFFFLFCDCARFQCSSVVNIGADQKLSSQLVESGPEFGIQNQGSKLDIVRRTSYSRHY